ncbi:complement factor B-like [Hyperolius riggenbachi]|uniref:complement factor B-like n=1 Tax=Hyperolius riggenbachi TaxID=752182 RepID=UPI0035A37F5E
MLPLLLLCSIAISVAEGSCDISKVGIIGGTFKIIDGEKNGIKVQFSCPKGKYPHPEPVRECRNGQWKNGNTTAECRDVECPPPSQRFEGGYVDPFKRKYIVGDVIGFQCFDGYKMFGSQIRACLENGKWSGTTTVCDDQEGYCLNPGTPMGANILDHDFRIGGKVKYKCQNNLKMFGSDVRTCLENRKWSGTEPSCRYWYTYDTPKEVSEEFSSSLSETIESSDPNRDEGKHDRKLEIKKGGLMNIFIILDASQSVGQENFNLAKEAIIIFIEKVSSYDFVPRYCIISYATQAKSVVSMADDDNTDADAVIENLEAYGYDEHEDKRGTNTNAAFLMVDRELSLFKLRYPDTFFSTSNVIILMTDGKHNMGGDPMVGVNKVKTLLNVTKEEEALDIYVFGVGDEISQEELNDIASKKRNEKHVFQLESVQDMKDAFDDMINEVEAFEMCGLSRDHVDDSKEKYPWIAKISIIRLGRDPVNCKGSIISRNFILTAAHCILLDDPVEKMSVVVGDGISRKVKDVHRHPSFDLDGKKDKHVPRSFDYDFAIIELDRKLLFDKTIRPICLPCTTGASWALKLRGKAESCEDHEHLLLPAAEEQVKALFIGEERINEYERLDVTIKTGTKRQGCLDDAKKVPDFKDVVDIRDAVTDNFLCTGGTSGNVEPQTCKGDSGGPLMIQYKKRFIEVGVVSWGTINSCTKDNMRPQKVPTGSRDFHSNVFHAIKWIVSIAKEELLEIGTEEDKK